MVAKSPLWWCLYFIGSRNSSAQNFRVAWFRSPDLIVSQEDKPRTHRSTRQIARETGVSQSSVVRIVNKNLSLKCFKRRRAQERTESNRLARLVRSRQLLKRYQEHDVAFVWFTDEKIFTVAVPSNSQNDRAYAAHA